MHIKIKILGDAYAYQVPQEGKGGGDERGTGYWVPCTGLRSWEIVHVLWLIYDFILHSFFSSCSPVSLLFLSPFSPLFLPFLPFSLGVVRGYLSHFNLIFTVNNVANFSFSLSCSCLVGVACALLVRSFHTNFTPKTRADRRPYATPPCHFLPSFYTLILLIKQVARSNIFHSN